MKIRFGFVSNSSTSSFVCDTCGEQFAGMDMSPCNVDHQECVNGHIFCDEEMINKDKFDKLVELAEEVDIPKEVSYEQLGKPEIYEKYGLGDDQRYEVPEEFCPVCQMAFISPGEVTMYIYEKYNITHVELVAEIKSKFNTYKDFLNYFKKKS